MYKKVLLIFIILTTISCKAQNPIISLDASYNTPNGAYYKDLNNELNKFEGIWKFTSSNKELIISIKKIEQVKIRNKYRDYLVGEYSYKENGIELINTLPLNINEDSNIGGSYISKPNEFPICDICNPNERRIDMFFIDPDREYLNSGVVLRYVSNSNPQQIEITIYEEHGAILPYEGAPTNPRVPYGKYVLTKQ